MPTLFQCLVQTLLSQDVDGLWGCQERMEETAYAILTLANLLVLPLALFFRPELRSAMDRDRAFLQKSSRHRPEYLWIEKNQLWVCKSSRSLHHYSPVRFNK